MATLTFLSHSTKYPSRLTKKAPKTRMSSETFKMDYDHALNQMSLLAAQLEKEEHQVHIFSYDNQRPTHISACKMHEGGLWESLSYYVTKDNIGEHQRSPSTKTNIPL